ncbi:MAG TPA: dockerin type I repeat-containing protein, partial [Candidatus Glassbacteria bacterium]|nr:dockerin type I repeat-containing protein [Candidatus Glassbacteria bacterium]
TFKVRFAGGSFTQDLSFALTVGNVPTPAVESYATHDVNRAWLTVTNFGMLGKEGNSGGGFVYPRVNSSSPDHLFHGALLVGINSSTVSDESYSADQSSGDIANDHDFAAVAGGNLVIDKPGQYADQEITGAYSDSRASPALGVSVNQRSYAWSGTDWTDFVIVEYDLQRTEDPALSGVYAGQHFDWDVGGSAEDDMVAYESGPALAYMFDKNTASYVGHVLLTQAVSGFRAVNFTRDVQDGFTPAEKFGALTVLPSDTVVVAPDDWSEILSAGPINLPKGRIVAVAFAVVGGVGLEDLRANAEAAREKWAQLAAQRGLDTGQPVITFIPIRNQPPSFGNYLLHCKATDSGSSVDEVLFFWRDAGAAEWTSVKATPLFNSGYDVLFPKRPENTRVQYFIRAFDEQGNQANSPDDAPQSYYSFLVGDTTLPKITATAAALSADGKGVEISAVVTDSNLYRVYSVILDQESGPDTVEMSPGDGDSYSATVSGLVAGALVLYYVAAEDSTGNMTLDPPAAPESYYSFAYTPFLAGDGDLDGRIDIFDLLAMLRVLSGRATPTAQQVLAMDFNANGRVDIFDVIELLKLLARK